MEVQKQGVRKDSVSCNFCRRGRLNTYHNGLNYPYEDVFIFKGHAGGLCASICQDCIDELIKKSKDLSK